VTLRSSQTRLKLWVNGQLMQDSNTSRMIFDTGRADRDAFLRVTLYPATSS